MSHHDGYARMVELFDVRTTYVVYGHTFDLAAMESRFKNFLPRYDTTRQPELEYKPVVMPRAKSLQVFGAMPNKLRLEVTYARHAESLSYSGAYLIQWASETPIPIGDETPELALLGAPDMREAVAELCHTQWANWTGHFLSKGRWNKDGSITIPREFALRWQRQSSTSYVLLSKSEQDSDRREAHKFLHLIARRLSG